MRKNGLKQRLFHIALATAIAVSSISVTPGVSVQVQAASDEGTNYAKRTFESSYDDQYAYSGNDLGCTYTKEKTTFKVWSPLATSVVLCRYKKGNGGSVIEEVPMTMGDKGVWSVTIEGDIVNTYYTYKVTANGTTKEAVDIYAKAAGVNGDRAMVVDLDSTDPKNWDTNYQREKTLLSDIIVWEVHIRDFSIDVSSGVSQENRGKYKAFTEDTTINGEGRVASCVNYLEELGVTHVQLLPMYDYASVDETKVTTSLGSNYNWGYDPENYNVPEGSYSSNPYDGNVRITEMKEMIQALHDAGIKVIMDVVYNHTYDTANSNFNKIMPDYYYKINSDLSYNNQSGCGNATRSTSAMYRKFMIDSLTYWAEEYNLDGFRFDLMGIHDVTTMNQIRKALDDKFGEDTIVLYGEGWTATESDGDSAWKGNEAQLDDGIGYFNDQIRDAIKGDHEYSTAENQKAIGLVQANYVTNASFMQSEKWPNNVFGGIMGSVGVTNGDQWGMWRPFWSKSSNCSLSYTSAHDNLTLWDKLVEYYNKDFDSTREELLKMNKMAGSVVLVSKGGTFMQAGEEFARTKYGDHNSYQSADSTNKIDWTRVNTYSSVQKYYEGMIKIRKAFSGFRSIMTRSGDNWNPNNNNMTWINKDAFGLTAFYETNNVAGEWEKIAVLINNATSDTTVNLSEANQWVIIADGTTAGLKKIKETGSSVTVPAKSVVVAVPKATFEACNITENKAPVITADRSHETSVGTAVSFQVKASDRDGDTVTLKAENVPSGASFDTTTGNFSWESPVAGTYTITVTASDGKATTTKKITIEVIEKTTALKTYVAAIEDENLTAEQFTSDVWTPFEAALAQAKEVISVSETDEVKISEAMTNLKSAYESLSEQKTGRENLEAALSEGEAKVATAKGDAENYSAEAVADLETVIAEAKTFLSSPAEASEYESMIEDVQAAASAVVSLKANPVIRVKASDWSSPAIWVWNDTTKENYTKTGAWPGDKLTTKDSEGWYVYDLPQGATGYSVIINDGATGTSTQTADIAGIKESADITVTSFTGKTCTYTKVDKPVGTGEAEVTKELLGRVLTQAAAIGENQETYTEESYAAFTTAYTTAQKVNSDTEATQVTVNQTVRGLKKAISGLETAGDITVTPTVDPTPSVGPSETPTPTVDPTPSIDPSEIPTPTVEATPIPTDVITVTPTPTSEPIIGKVVVHFKSSEGNVSLFYQNKSDSVNKNVWQEAAMISGANGWFTYTIDNCQRAKVYCVVAGNETEQYTIEEGEWWYADDSWNGVNPDEYVTATLTPIVTKEPTTTPIVTVEATATPTATIVPTGEGTATPTVTAVPTTVPTDTPTATIVPTITAAPDVTVTKTPTVTAVPTTVPTQDPTVTDTPTGVPTVVVTKTPVSTPTNTPTSTNIPESTNTPTPTKMVSKTPTNTPTPTKMVSKTPTNTPTPTKIVSKTPTNTPTPIQKKKVSLKVKPQNTTEAKLTWGKVSGTKIYKIYRATSKNGKYKVVGTLLGSNEKSYVDTDLTCGETYYYYVQAYAKPANKLVCIGATNKVKVKAKPAKATVSSVKAIEGNQAKITWKKLKNVTGYEIYFSTSKKGKYKKLATVKGASKKTYTVAMEQTGKYYFKVRAYKTVKGKKVYGSYSSVKSATIK